MEILHTRQATMHLNQISNAKNRFFFFLIILKINHVGSDLVLHYTYNEYSIIDNWIKR